MMNSKIKEDERPKVSRKKLLAPRHNKTIEDQPTTGIPVMSEQPKKYKSRFLKILLMIIFIILIPIVAAALAIWWYTKSFSNAAQIDQNYIFQIVKQGYESNPFAQKNSLNFLFLGLDQVGQNRQNSLLTDTILIINLASNGKIKVIPIPRDLWVDGLKTKVNALYYYGEKSQDITGEQLVEKTLEQITGQQIDYALVLNLDTVKLIIDQVGGIDIEVDHAFTDEQFPRDDVPPDTLPVEARYKTITFQQGWQHMDGARALEFIRSRKSNNEQENTDESRAKRQQKVILALFRHLTQKETLVKPEVYGALYTIWKQSVQTNIMDSQIIGIIKSLASTSPSFEIIQIPIQTASSSGIIFNPPIRKHDQWVYEPIDPTWLKFAEFFNQKLESSGQ